MNIVIQMSYQELNIVLYIVNTSELSRPKYCIVYSKYKRVIKT